MTTITLPSGHRITHGREKTVRTILGKDFWRALSEAEQRAIAGSAAQAAKALLWELAICQSLTQAEALAALNRMETAGFIDATRKAQIIDALR